ncbi:MAG: hypothetical protein Q8P18_14485 [Pseudomonadota bacterium]|nr:hypothetical protein [Pseudomonadota bacterium]
MSRGLQPEGEAVRNAVRWIAAQRKEHPEERLPELLEEAGLRFDLTPIEQEALRAILTPAPTGA